MVTKASNTVFNIKQVPASFAQANAAFTSANNVAPQVQPSFDKANAAYLHANAAFNSANNVAPQVQPAFDKANAAFAAANSVNVYDANTNSTGFFALPQGTTAQRPASPANGAIRFNTTTGAGEMYFSSNGWVTFAGEPVITDVTPTTFNGTSGTAFNIYGYRLQPDAQIFFLSSNGASYLAGSVSYFSPTLIVATTPKNFTVAEEPLSVKIVQGSGTYIKSNVIDCGGVPSWITTAGGLGSIFGVNTVNVYVSASDPEGNAITYSIKSGSLPGGLSLRSANGLIQGLANSVLTNTTYNFTITASDSVNETDRTFSYIVLNRVPIFNTASSLSNITDSMLDNYSANVTVNAYDPDGGSITYSLTSGSVPTGFTFNTSNATLLLTNANTAEVTTNTTSTFTVSATDQGNDSETRQFTLVVEHPKDQDFPNTVLLLSATDSNTIIKDASSNNLNLVVYGDARATNFSPYNSSWSNVFDGSGDYLTTASYPGLNLNLNNNWTVEGWFYRTGSLGNQSTFASLGAGGSNVYWTFSVGGTNGTVSFGAGAGNWNFTSTAESSTNAIALNRWYHVAWVRNGATTLSMYVDGVQVYNNTSFNFGSATQGGTLHIGTYYANYNNDGSWYSGYISNFRIVNGTSIYTSAFTPPTTPLSNVANTVLLTSHKNRFVNESNTSTSFTRNGDVKVVGWSPFAETDTSNGSMYFDGTGDYVQMMTPYNFGSNNFTVEGWFYLTNISDTALWGGSNGGGQIPKLQAYISSGTLGIDLNGISVISVTASSYLKAYSWNHMAVCRGGTSTNQSALFINGVRAGTGTIGSQTGVTTNWGIGYMELGAIKASYIADFRIVDGTDVYGYTNTTYTVPTTPLANIANTKLLTLQNRQPHNNHGFQDKSNNKFLITRNGNSTQGTFSPFSAEVGKWSGYFDGSNDYLAIASNSAFHLAGSAVDFTIEAWIYPTGSPKYSVIAAVWGQQGTASSGGDQWIIHLSSSGELQFTWSPQSTAGAWLTGSVVPFNKWSHVAVTRQGNDFKLFLNGNQTGPTGTQSATYSGLDRMTIGYYGAGAGVSATSYWAGYISNFRLTKGTALYTANTTISSQPLTAITNTSVLTCLTNRFVDISNNNFSVTPSDQPIVQAFSPFAPNSYYTTANTGGGGYFDGTGDYLTSESSPVLALGSGDFLIEGWYYYQNNSAGGGFVYDTRTSGSEGSSRNYLYMIGSTLYLGVGSADDINLGAINPINQWTHFALVRTGSSTNNIGFYINGSRVYQRTDTTNFSTATYVTLMRRYALEYYVGGHLGSFRIVKGQSIYNSANSTITVPTTPFTSTPNTVFLMNFTDAGIIDYTGKNNLETVGDAKANNIIYKFAPGAFSFDGTGDYLYAIQNGSNLFLTGDFTIEAWIRFNTVGNGQIISAGPGNVTNAYYWQYYSSQLQFGNQGGANIAATNWTPNANQWYHVSVCRSGTSVRQFVDGVQLGSTITSSQSFVDGPTYVGYGGAGYFNGTITDLRVTKSARYTANFTPRPRKLPRR